ncbi:hypothetical protein BDD12DRAFT_780041 [Trichophaea hybrida]|nr:hypothetical protein BDD12DRAFT_780041 [Trichophaea hybrida]
MWLRHFLSTEFPGFRVMTYGYNSKLGSAGIHTLPDYDAGFLYDLVNVRSTPKVESPPSRALYVLSPFCMQERSRPIIFIYHSFGGLIVSKVEFSNCLLRQDQP